MPLPYARHYLEASLNQALPLLRHRWREQALPRALAKCAAITSTKKKPQKPIASVSRERPWDIFTEKQNRGEDNSPPRLWLTPGFDNTIARPS
jgi:hypothetical protein